MPAGGRLISGEARCSGTVSDDAWARHPTVNSTGIGTHGAAGDEIRHGRAAGPAPLIRCAAGELDL